MSGYGAKHPLQRSASTAECGLLLLCPLLRHLSVSARSQLVRLPPPPTPGWTYWELRKEWRHSQQKDSWDSLPTPLFDFDTVEDFFIGYNKAPHIECVLGLGWCAAG